jgi:hypothetical protein
VRLEGLGQLKKCNDLIGNHTRDLPACNIAPQPNYPTPNDRVEGVIQSVGAGEWGC